MTTKNMTRLFIATYFVLGSIMHAQAALHAFPTNSSGDVKLTKQEFVKRFNVKEPVCVKSGVSVKFYNDAYLEKYKSDKQPCRKKWVTIIKLKDIETATQQEMLGYK